MAARLLYLPLLRVSWYKLPRMEVPVVDAAVFFSDGGVRDSSAGTHDEATVHAQRAFPAARINFSPLTVGSAAVSLALRRIPRGE